MTPTEREFFARADTSESPPVDGGATYRRMSSSVSPAQPYTSWFSIGLKFGFGFFCAGFLFSILLSLLWVLFLGAFIAGTHR